VLAVVLASTPVLPAEARIHLSAKVLPKTTAASPSTTYEQVD